MIHARTVALSDYLSSANGEAAVPSTTGALVARILEGLDKTDGLFMVVQDLYPIESANDAHLVLPAASWGEADIPSINCNSRLLRLYEKFMDPPGEAKPDWEISALIGQTLERMYAREGNHTMASRFSGMHWTSGSDVFMAAQRPGINVTGSGKKGRTRTTSYANEVSVADEATLDAQEFTGVTYEMLSSVVRFSLAGVEPDLDPIDRMIISVTLRDTRPSGQALPTGTLILSTYLENFQPQTTPILPDLLNQQRVATNLGGFLQGKAALMTRAGRIAYRGSVLAETFLDNQVRMIVDLQRVGAPLSEQDVRLAGALTMRKNLTLAGALHALAPLTVAQIAPLRAASGRSMSWQEVVAGMAVRFPRMMGTGGATAATPAPQQIQAQQPALTAVAGLSAAPAYHTARKAAAPRPGGGSATFPAVDSGAATFAGGMVLIVLALTWGGIGGRPWRRLVRQRRAPGNVSTDGGHR